MIFIAIEYAQWTGGLGVLIAAIGGIYTTYRKGRKDPTDAIADNAAVLLGGWVEFQATTRKDMETMRADFQKQISDLKAQHAAERTELLNDSRAKQVEIDGLKAEIQILKEARHRDI